MNLKGREWRFNHPEPKAQLRQIKLWAKEILT